jgi:hypothetical protein
MTRLSLLLIAVYSVISRSTESSSRVCVLDAVILTTGKDSLAFERSINSSLKHFSDVRNYYIITPHEKELARRWSNRLGPRVKFVGETLFPFNAATVADIMYNSVKDAGVYPLTGKSPFEGTMYGKIGWFLQQLLKLYAGRVLGLGDFILLDSDCVWFNDVKFIAACNATHKSFYYASSSQYHPPYMNTIGKISGVGPIDTKVHRSGIVHHMVLAKHVLEGLMNDTERRHDGMPFWQVMLNVSAREMTCRAPRTSVCGEGSTLSEYELYFHYARIKYPETVTLRPLMWTNGPAPGLLYWPKLSDGLTSDGRKHHWLHHRQRQAGLILDHQILSDRLQGYDYVGYHAYAKRRYSELVGEDLETLCRNVTEPRNSTCSWRGHEELEISHLRMPASEQGLEHRPRSAEDYFKGCACWMARHQSGP